MFNMFVDFVVMVTLVPCKSFANFLNLLIQNGDIYMAVELPCKQIAKSEQDLLDLYFCDLF